MKNQLQKHKWKVILPILLLGCIFIFRIHLLGVFGSFLIKVDDPIQSDVVYVLGGNSEDRGSKAAELYHSGFSNELVCIGGNWHTILEDYGITTLESEVAKKVIENKGVPSDNIRLITNSTSTLEEKIEIIEDIKQKNYKRIIIVTDKFHSRRVRSLFEDELDDLDVQFTLVGAENSKYKEDSWWEEERGLIMVDNEYMKSIYYFLK